jgi:hypothetical protein
MSGDRKSEVSELACIRREDPITGYFPSSSNRPGSMAPRCGKGSAWQLRVALVMSAYLAAFSHGVAAEEMKWHHSHHISKAETVDVGDVPGHVVGVARATGVGFFDGGEVATLVTSGTFDYRDGAGKTAGYVGYTFEDGSTFYLRYDAVTTPDSGGAGSSFKGEFSFTEGTGRFRRIKGGGSLSGRRLSLLGGGSEVYFNFTGTYSREQGRAADR